MGNQGKTASKGSASAGFSLIEVVISMGIAAIGMLGFSQAIVTAVALSEASQEEALAREGNLELIESLDAVPFDEILARYDSTTDDDPLDGEVALAAFAVKGLRALTNDEDGLVGEILFPTVETAEGLELREDLVDLRLGMPRDLNGDGLIDGADHSGDYILLPVRVRVTWRGHSGPSSLEYLTILTAL